MQVIKRRSKNFPRLAMMDGTIKILLIMKMS
jgi:hypothetical protein